MSEKNIKARVIHKHDTEANWSLATNFTPKQGEIIVYDVDATYTYERFKIGDGVTNVNSLPFVTSIGISGASVGQIIKVKEVDDLGRPTAWEVSDQVQSDWDQNSSSQPDYIKNRTHKREEVVVSSFTLSALSGTTTTINTGSTVKTFTVDSKTGEMPNGTSVYCSISGDPPILLPQISIPSYVIDDTSSTGYGDPSVFDSDAYVSNNSSVHDNGLDIGVGRVYSSPNEWTIRVSSDSKYFNYDALTLEFGTLETVYTPLDENYIPMTVPRVASASAGDILRVKTVDENSVPTGWEVAKQVQPDWTQNDTSKPDYIKNKPAEYGKTAYEIACQNGFSGTESEWLASLVGPSGATGATGNSAFVRFAYSNTGQDMTEKWNEGQSYIGFSTALQAPTDPAEYEWCQFVTPYTPSGWTSDQISLLEVILNNIAYIDTTTGQTAAVNLIESLRNRAITDDITQSGSVLTIRALANTPTQSGSVLSIT